MDQDSVAVVEKDVADTSVQEIEKEETKETKKPRVQRKRTVRKKPNQAALFDNDKLLLEQAEILQKIQAEISAETAGDKDQGTNDQNTAAEEQAHRPKRKRTSVQKYSDLTLEPNMSDSKQSVEDTDRSEKIEVRKSTEKSKSAKHSQSAETADSDELTGAAEPGESAATKKTAERAESSQSTEDSQPSSEAAAESVTERRVRRRRHITQEQKAPIRHERSSLTTKGKTAKAVYSANHRTPYRKGSAQLHSIEPTLSKEALHEMKVAELRLKAQELDIEFTGLKKQQLIDEIYEKSAQTEGFSQIEGVVEIQAEGYGLLRTGNFAPGDDDAFIHQQLIRQYALRPGDLIQGTIGPARSGNKFPPLLKIDLIDGKSIEEVKNRPRFRDLTPVYPSDRLTMEHGKDSITGRAIDLVAPIGKGQRGLIVSPPKAGKTTILKKICQSISANNPEVHLFCLLVDERPEEVTDMQRSIKGQVVASTFDMPASNHTSVSELVIEQAKRLVELGEDVVVILDSITRLARAYNIAQPASGRVLSGGVDSAALYPPKKFLGAARNIEGGGSLTILASALIDTGSKMDEVIFEEFKGTGNMELKLDRDLADRRIFPAIDPVASGTRNEELLIDPELLPFIWGIRRVLANMNNTERAATALVRGLQQTNTNEEFLIRSAKKAQQNDFVA